MKKITFIFLFLLIASGYSQIINYSQAPDIKNFKITTDPNKVFGGFNNPNQRLDFEFEILGTYSTVYLSLYYRTVSPENLINNINWNADRDDPLVFTSYFLKKTWLNNSNRVFTISGERFILVARHLAPGINQSTQIIYNVPAIDTDGDGIQNSQDQCPTVAGPSSNNGCPLFVQPKFQLTQAKLIQNNQSWNIFNTEKPTLNANPYSNGTPTTTFDFTFNTNNGTTSPNLRGDIKIYISNRSVLGTGNNIWVKELYQNYINYTPNDEIKITPSLTIPAIVNTPNGTYVMQDEETYYLHLVMYEIINFTQNRYVFPFKLNRLDVTSKSIDFSNTEISPSYNIEVFDLYGRKIFTKETKSKVEENNITLDLPKGIYIIKSKNGDRKVFVD